MKTRAKPETLENDEMLEQHTLARSCVASFATGSELWAWTQCTPHESAQRGSLRGGR